MLACLHADTHIVVNKAALRRGWVNFPFRFDPFWIEKCDNKNLLGTTGIE